QVVPVGQPREPAAPDAEEEAVEGALGHVLLVGGAAGQAAELDAGEADQPAEVALPEPLGGGRVAAAELSEPAGDGAGRRHGGGRRGPRPGWRRGSRGCGGWWSRCP